MMNGVKRKAYCFLHKNALGFYLYKIRLRERMLGVKTLFLLVFFAVVSPAMGSIDIPLSHSSPGDRQTEDYDPFTGNLTLSVTDAVIPGNGGLTLKLMHSFNHAAGYSKLFTHALPVKYLHYHSSWVVGLNMPRITSEFAGLEPELYLILPEGQVYPFFQNGSTSVLITRNNYKLTVSSSEYTLDAPDGIHYHYTKDFYLTQVQDSHGNSLTFQYASSGNQLRYLQKVVASDGRVVTFEYDAMSSDMPTPQWIKITSNDQIFEYHFQFFRSNNENLYELTEVRRPDGTSWRYGYDTPVVRSPGLDLTGVYTPQGGVIHYAFNETHGKSPLIENGVRRAPLAEKTLSGSGLTPATWDYSYAIGSSESVTRVTEPSRITVYHYAFPYYGQSENSAAFMFGTLRSEDVYNLDSELMESTAYQWSSQSFNTHPSPQKYDHNCLMDSGGGEHCGSVRYRPQLLSRDIKRDGVDYQTQYGSYTAYNQPGSMDETGDNQKKRHTEISYYNNASIWNLGQILKKSVEGRTVIENNYDEFGSLLSQSRWGVETQYTYDKSGNRVTATDANGHTTQFLNYLRGIPQTIINADESKITREVNLTGTVASQTDPLNHVTQFQYDSMNRISSIIYPNQSMETTIYNDKAGLGSYVQSRENLQRVHRVDGLGRVVQTVFADSKKGLRYTEDTQYDSEGRVIYQSYPYEDKPHGGRNYSFDALGRISSDLLTHEYLPNHRIKLTDRKGQVTLKDELSFGDPKEAFVIQIIQPENVITAIERDSLGHILSVTQGDLTRSYHYDEHYFLSSVDNPETGTTVYARDAVGNILSTSVGDSGVIKYIYDPLNRITEIDYPDNSASVIKSYFSNGLLKSVKKGNIQENYLYDNDDNLTDEYFHIRNKNFRIRYQYDALDHLYSMIYPDNSLIELEPDAWGRPTKLGDLVSDISYFPNHDIQSMAYSNGDIVKKKQEGNLIQNLNITGKDSLFNFDYTYDENGHLKSISEANDPGYGIALGYDSLDRLISAQGKWSTQYTYTVNNDIKTRTQGNQIFTYEYDDTNKLISIKNSPNRYKYNVYGDVIESGVNFFVYGADRDLYQVFNKNKSILYTYQYDGHHHRLIETDKNGNVEYLLYNYQGKLLFETNGIQDWIKNIYYLNGARVAQVEVSDSKPLFPDKKYPEKITFFHNDLWGSPIIATDSDGKLLWKQYYQPYGERMNKVSGTGNSLWYRGIKEDISGILYFGNRYYDPAVGRFMNVKACSFNCYSYSADNPYKSY